MIEVKKMIDLRKIYKEIEQNLGKYIYKYRKQATILAMTGVLGLTGCSKNPNRIDTTKLPTKTMEKLEEKTKENKEEILNKIKENKN